LPLRSRGQSSLPLLFAAPFEKLLQDAILLRGIVRRHASRLRLGLHGVDATGRDCHAIEPLLERTDRFAYVLCRTSNPGAGEVQGLRVNADAATGAPEEPLHARIARRAAGWGPGGTVGLVVGATAPDELRAIRAIAPGLAFLVPGVGAQGGEVEPVLEAGQASAPPAGGRPGGGLLVNVSRAIAGAASSAGGGVPSDPLERVAAAAREWAGRLPVLP